MIYFFIIYSRHSEFGSFLFFSLILYRRQYFGLQSLQLGEVDFAFRVPRYMEIAISVLLFFLPYFLIKYKLHTYGKVQLKSLK